MVDCSDLIGIPFVDSGRTKAGYDCWGLCMEVASRYNHMLPEFNICAEATFKIAAVMESNKELADHGQNPNWIKLETPEPGCLILLTNSIVGVNHAGIYLGDKKFIHTLINIGSHIDRIDSPLWKRRIKGFYRYVG
jgi:cell wall-associated NlpC family hydrolase